MNRARRICNSPGCNETVTHQRRYCDRHKHESKGLRDLKTADENKRFYKTSRWTKTSRRYRQQHPLCERCIKIGMVEKAVLVHHDPELTELLKQSLGIHRLK